MAGSDSKTKSVVGSFEYFAPEIITNQGHNRMADWWTFGIFLYEMVVGHPPFYSSNDNEMLTMIMKYNFAFPQGLQISENVQNLIRGLLIKNPDSR